MASPKILLYDHTTVKQETGGLSVPFGICCLPARPYKYKLTYVMHAPVILGEQETILYIMFYFKQNFMSVCKEVD